VEVCAVWLNARRHLPGPLSRRRYRERERRQERCEDEAEGEGAVRCVLVPRLDRLTQCVRE
jgi:hypothetical protein